MAPFSTNQKAPSKYFEGESTLRAGAEIVGYVLCVFDCERPGAVRELSNEGATCGVACGTPEISGGQKPPARLRS